MATLPATPSGGRDIKRITVAVRRIGERLGGLSQDSGAGQRPSSISRTRRSNGPRLVMAASGAAGHGPPGTLDGLPLALPGVDMSSAALRRSFGVAEALDATDAQNRARCVSHG